ncbi:nitroreductase family protein [Candidatus Aerophobetes bacterium]|nr:nitroreductase family protein [Candidatus Aerophobetes bacterium]
MNIYEMILKRRTIRRFQRKKVPYEVLEKCVNAARLAPSAANLQPCEYLIVDEEDLLNEVFGTLQWAGYISDGSPPASQRPTAYIMVLINQEVKTKGFEHDVGMAVENIILTALEEGVGSCCFGAVEREELRKRFNIPQKYIINLVIALGYPNESPVEEPFENSVKYWKDKKGLLHVPKRKLKDILHRNTISPEHTSAV